MSSKNHIKTDIPDIKISNAPARAFFNKASIIGKIPQTIGHGEDAKNSLIYLTLKWAFIAGCVITTLIVANHWCCQHANHAHDLTNDIALIWDIIVPIITLALGYAFGRSGQ